MTIETLFGKEDVSAVADGTSKPRTIRFKQIKAVYETLTVKEEITDYSQHRKPQPIDSSYAFCIHDGLPKFGGSNHMRP